MNKRFMTLIVGVIYEDEVSGVVGNILGSALCGLILNLKCAIF